MWQDRLKEKFGDLYFQQPIIDFISQLLKEQSILFTAEFIYRKVNPDSKMDIPSIVYEEIEKAYNKFNQPEPETEGEVK